MSRERAHIVGEKGICMMKGRILVAVAFAGATLSACSGGEEEAAPAATEAAATAAADPAAAAPAATAVAADNTDTIDGVAFASLTGDAAKGKTIFLQCQACHALEPGVNKIGPSLAGIIGRAAGSVEGYSYSPANKNSGITWSPEKMFQYLENPQRVIPGTKMAFGGLASAQDRADVIAYLQSGGN